MRQRSVEHVVCHENLESLLSACHRKYFHAVATIAPGRTLFAESVPPSRLVPLRVGRRVRPFLNDDAMLRCSDLAAQMRRVGATGFVPSYRSSPTMERWARLEGHELLSPSNVVQKSLENKILFDRVLHQHELPAPDSFELTEAKQVSSIRSFPLVCQLPRSEGTDGTFLITSRRELRRMLDKRTLWLPLLCRTLVEGRVLGITIVVGAEELILSALRDQCRNLERRGEDFAGIQWVSFRRLSRKQRANIERTMTRLGQVLRQTGFVGAASVDFVLAGERVLIIECNPRFSSATPHLSAESSLLHGLDFFGEYLRAVRGRPLSAHLPRLPDSTFEGTFVDFSDHVIAALKVLRRRVVNSLPRLGVHDFAEGALRFVSTNVADLPGDRRLLFYYSSPPGECVGKRTDLGSLYTGFPLFDTRGPYLVPNELGAALFCQLREQVRLNQSRTSLEALISAPKSAFRGSRIDR